MGPLINAFTEVLFIMEKKMLMRTLILQKIIGIGPGTIIISYVMGKEMEKLLMRTQIKSRL